MITTIICIGFMVVGFLVIGYVAVVDEIEYHRPRKPEPPMPGCGLWLPDERVS